MDVYWTVEQAIANAEIFAEEFSNRQILLYGFGEPSAKAPVGAEYEDRSILPPTRYRKTGENDEDWTKVQIVETATSQEVTNGVSNEKMVTPATLSERLNSFADNVLNLPTQSQDLGAAAFSINANDSIDNSPFIITMPETSHAAISIQIFSYALNSKLTNIIGGQIGQVVILRRGESHALEIESTGNIKISSLMQFDDNEKLDNISLQRISTSIWVEVGRN